MAYFDFIVGMWQMSEFLKFFEYLADLLHILLFTTDYLITENNYYSYLLLLQLQSDYININYI